MSYKVTTEPTTEPVTLAEAKLHLRQTAGAFDEDVVTAQSIVPKAHTAGTVTGTAVDVFGTTAVINLNAGTVGTSVVVVIQESDDDTTYTTFGTFTTVTTANDNAVLEMSYTGGKQYVKAVATVVGTSAFSVDVVTFTGDPQEDDLINDLISTARAYCENFCGQALGSQTVTMWLDRFPFGEIRLPLLPLIEVTSVKYTDYEGTETAFTDYIADTSSPNGRIVLAYGKSWPSFIPYPVNPIEIIYTAGYVTAPKPIKQAILLLIGTWYENRTSIVATGAIAKEIPLTSKALLMQYKNRWWD
jgi:uncharacterized phiE125 gp8 family phage protein